MTKTFGWRVAPLILAATFALSYAALVLGTPAILAQFQDFKIEMPALTRIAIYLTRLFTAPGVTAVGSVVMLSLTFAIAIGEKWAWWVGLAFTLFFGVCLFSTVLPLIALINGLSGDDDVSVASTQFPWLQISPILLASLLPTILFLALRRSFWRHNSNQSQANARVI